MMINWTCDKNKQDKIEDVNITKDRNSTYNRKKVETMFM